MESLTGLNVTDEKDRTQLSVKSKQEPEIERVKLGKVESAKVAVWLKQLGESSKYWRWLEIVSVS